MKPVKTTVRRHFYHVLSNYITITLGSRLPRSWLRRLSDFCLLAHIYCCYSTRSQLTSQQLLYGQAGPAQLTARMQLQVSSVQNTGPRYRASYRIQGRTQYKQSELIQHAIYIYIYLYSKNSFAYKHVTIVNDESTVIGSD